MKRKKKYLPTIDKKPTYIVLGHPKIYINGTIFLKEKGKERR